MSFWPLFLIALGVSADAFAVALGKGLHMKKFNLRHAIIIAVTFGLFQAVMPLLGWLLGTQLSDYITSIDHWVAFGLLAGIGGKMLWEAFSSHEDTEKDSDALDVRELLVLAVATSIDALAVGISFAFLSVSIGGAATLIGVTTMVTAFVGIVLGRRMGARFGAPAEIAGGLILCFIGLHILLEHLGVW
ncbi:Putative Mn2+ efflux pump MntP [Sanguibacter gelidistatuariae]|uniref:Putative manganese efflux pump MntP n=1 Tax=Sanguibacter gelidistatuariae TaxID=1814289 RepID=A0A1G6HYA6_9MICO|nr:manganese efflux pump MntP family protein [Sanguibacter gelidistatuariae]SDB98795.1 Putative Mn2+ efflux pump MntP [Sanguibacter gelidistatuariae]